MSVVEKIEVATATPDVAAELKPIREGNGVVETDRKLARIVVLDDVIKHPNADALSLAIIGGWQCVVKLDEYKKGDRVVYCEIDSLLPIDNPLFGFLEARRSDNRLINGKAYHRLRTLRLRKELAQGLVVPLPEKYKDLPAETNMTLELGILKFAAKPLMSPAQQAAAGSGWYMRLVRKILGNVGNALLPWPKQLLKSDQDRIQNKTVAFEAAKAEGTEFEVTWKLDGSSMTVFCLDDGGVRTGVCSRNYELVIGDEEWSKPDQIRYWIGTLLARNRNFLKPKSWFFKDEDGKWAFRMNNLHVPEWKANTGIGDSTSRNFTRYVTKNKVVEKLKAYQEETGEYITVQGELIGPDIQSGFEGVEDVEYHVYSVYRNGSQELLPEEARGVCAAIGLPYVPVMHEKFVIPVGTTIQDILLMAEGPRAFNVDPKQPKKTYREGLVFKCTDRVFSFKAVSTQYLEKKKDDEE
jgi:hypothetical protein